MLRCGVELTLRSSPWYSFGLVRHSRDLELARVVGLAVSRRKLQHVRTEPEQLFFVVIKILFYERSVQMAAADMNLECRPYCEVRLGVSHNIGCAMITRNASIKETLAVLNHT
jgi:hypothetical protein